MRVKSLGRLVPDRSQHQSGHLYFFKAAIAPGRRVVEIEGHSSTQKRGLTLNHPTRGIDRILVFGPLFFAPPMAVFAAQHFTEARAVATLVPSWMPGHLFWTYFVGTALIAASTSIALNKQAQWAAILLAVMLII